MAPAVCPRCGTRLLPNALACINCELPIPQPPAAPAGPPPYRLPYQMPAYGQPPPYAPPTPYAPPPYGAQPPYVGPVPYAPGYYPMGPAPWTTNGLAVASLVLAVVWLGGIGSVLAVIFGHVSRGQIKRQAQRGAGIALAGLIIGYVGIAGSIGLYASLPTIVHSNTVQDFLVQQDIRDAASAETDLWTSYGSYSTDPSDLTDHGFHPIGNNTISIAVRNSAGFCIVGGRLGGSRWYLYDSGYDDIVDTTYADEAEAEGACSVPGATNFHMIA